MHHIYTRVFSTLLLFSVIIPNGTLFAQGSLDLTDVTPTPWRPPGSLSQTFSNIGNSLPPVTVKVTVNGNVNRFVNTTPRNDARGLWLSTNFASLNDVLTVQFDFSDPVMNLNFGIRSIDRDLRIGNYQDRVFIEGYDNNNVGVTPNISYNLSQIYQTDGASSFIKILSGYNEDFFDTTVAVVRYGGGGIKKLILTYGSGREVLRGQLTAQSIFLTNLSWSNIVPVQLIYFKGKMENSRSQLNWATATEINSDFFSVQRSIDLKDFVDIGKVKSAGDSRQRLEYSYFDEAPLPGVNYYRLKQVDKDGASEFSKIIAISPQSNGSKFAIYPNPSNGSEVNLQFDSIDLDGLRLIDMLGRDINFKIEAVSGSNLKIVPSHELPNGLYFVTYSANGQSRTTQKLYINK